ncbi:MAG: uracil phosphoribosyltransferase [Candidatus Delongbacteria bacterium]|nr:uracil phosphoribosyltransferase [Candidatus Cloacimonadota bacterium]MCB9473708.1 uracil phosphoribosyltransferase [Candidatus Delongbacteria bacterium]
MGVPGTRVVNLHSRILETLQGTPTFSRHTPIAGANVPIILLNHPVIQHNLAQARNRTTDSETFAKMIDRISSLMVYEVSRDLPSHPVSLETPLETTQGNCLSRPLVLVPILRAGLGMVQGFKALLPDAMVAHLGLYRDEQTLEPVVYYKKLPRDLQNRDLIVLDPMLATGGTAVAALHFLKERRPATIRLVCVLAAPEGVKHVEQAHPDVPIYGAALDRELNSVGYILPGLGDAGDRIFGTTGTDDGDDA